MDLLIRDDNVIIRSLSRDPFDQILLLKFKDEKGLETVIELQIIQKFIDISNKEKRVDPQKIFDIYIILQDEKFVDHVMHTQMNSSIALLTNDSKKFNHNL